MRESGEMYLETILVLSQKQNRVRAVDVAAEMDISKVFMSLGVPEEVAVADACKIEHDVSDVTFNAIKDYLNRCQQPASAGE